jgi:hypothetical protein
LKCLSTGTQASWNSGMMAKKAGEVNMEEGQIRWPKGQWDSVLSYYGSGSASAKGFWSISLEQPMCVAGPVRSPRATAVKLRQSIADDGGASLLDGFG